MLAPRRPTAYFKTTPSPVQRDRKPKRSRPTSKSNQPRRRYASVLDPCLSRRECGHRHGRGLAAVARAEARRRVARNRPRREVPEGRADTGVESRGRRRIRGAGRREREGVRTRPRPGGESARERLREGRSSARQGAVVVSRREDRPEALGRGLPGRVHGELRRRAALHAHRGRRLRVHARCDGRPEGDQGRRRRGRLVEELHEGLRRRTAACGASRHTRSSTATS